MIVSQFSEFFLDLQYGIYLLYLCDDWPMMTRTLRCYLIINTLYSILQHCLELSILRWFRFFLLLNFLLPIAIPTILSTQPLNPASQQTLSNSLHNIPCQPIQSIPTLSSSNHPRPGAEGGKVFRFLFL